MNVAITGPEFNNASTTLNLFEIVIYADTTAWDGWVAQMSSTDATDAEHFENYSSYAM